MARKPGLWACTALIAIFLAACGSDDEKAQSAKACPTPPSKAGEDLNGSVPEPTAYVMGDPGQEWLETVGVLRQTRTSEDKLPVSSDQSQSWVEEVYVNHVRRVGPRTGHRRYYVVAGMSRDETAFACREGREPRPSVALWDAPGNSGIVKGTFGSLSRTTPKDFRESGSIVAKQINDRPTTQMIGLLPDGVVAVEFDGKRAAIAENFLLAEVPVMADDALCLEMSWVMESGEEIDKTPEYC